MADNLPGEKVGVWGRSPQQVHRRDIGTVNELVSDPAPKNFVTVITVIPLLRNITDCNVTQVT